MSDLRLKFQQLFSSATNRYKGNVGVSFACVLALFLLNVARVVGSVVMVVL